jgi:Phage portal protein.
MGFIDSLKHAWNVFKDPKSYEFRGNGSSGGGYGYHPNRPRFRYSNERSILASIFTRLGIDVAEADILHVQLDNEGRYLETRKSGLNYCLTVEPNIDQSPTHFRRDIVLTLCDEGEAVIVPVETTIDPESGSYDIKNLRVGKVVSYPRGSSEFVTIKVYNEQVGQEEQITVSKKLVAIVENPFYAVMNEPNSTLKRLIHKLNLLDAVDDQSSSGKLDLIIQLPYVVRSDARRQQAMQRRTDIENQLKGSKYGIAYTDGTEKVTQLNRPAENNLLKQIEYLTNLLYVQLGLTAEVMNGTADEATMLNYNNRTVKPFLTAIAESMKRKFLTRTAITQGQSIAFFRDAFSYVPLSQIAEIADKFTRNEILSSNEIRQGIGFKPSQDPKADQLRNSNMPQSALGIESTNEEQVSEDNQVQSMLDSLGTELDGVLKELENATA